MPQTVELVPSLPFVSFILFTSDTVQDTSHASDFCLSWSLLYHLFYLPQTQSKTLHMPQTVELVPSLPIVLFTSDTVDEMAIMLQGSTFPGAYAPRFCYGPLDVSDWGPKIVSIITRNPVFDQ